MRRAMPDPKTPMTADSIVRENNFDRAEKTAWFVVHLETIKNTARNVVGPSCWFSAPPVLFCMARFNICVASSGRELTR